MLQNFDTDLDTAGVTRMVKTTVAPVVTETVTVTLKPSDRTQFIAKSEDSWEWGDLRDFVVAEIEKRTGAFPRDFKKEAGIFKSFMARWGDKAPAIARTAFEVHEGMWKGAPISVNRFCKGSDPYFAQPIADRLSDQPIAGW